jgi:hypothetical protein
MKRKLLYIFMMVSCGVYSQDVYFKAGVNHTNYQYTTAEDNKSEILQSALGNAYEIGYRFPVWCRSRLGYEVGVILNEYNALVGVSYASGSWNTGYVGIQTALVYPAFVADSFSLDIKAGGGVSTILYGKQDLNGIVYDLRRSKDFNGAVFHAIVGLEANLQASEDWHLSIGYNYLQTLSTLKKPQKMSFEVSQVMFGVHFAIQ